jgi:hypothetical protein
MTYLAGSGATEQPMYIVTARKKETLSFAIPIDVTRRPRGRQVYPKAGKHKDKRLLPKVAQRARLRKESD